MPRVQNDPCTEPVRPVLLDKESVCKEEGKVEGSGVARLLLSRCNSVKDLKLAMVDGMTPEIDVSERSLKRRVSRLSAT